MPGDAELFPWVPDVENDKGQNRREQNGPPKDAGPKQPWLFFTVYPSAKPLECADATATRPLGVKARDSQDHNYGNDPHFRS
jgi:hypothetical protein